MLQFSTRSLLLSITLVTLGFGMMALVAQADSGLVVPRLFIGGCSSIGAGIFGIGKKPWLGAMLGGLFGIAVAIALAVYVMNAIR